MKLSANTNLLDKIFGPRATVDMFAAAGFDALDFSQFRDEFYTDAHDKTFYTELRDYAESKGLYYNQAHAPFGSSFTDEAQTEKRFEEITTAMRIASWLGVRNIIVHPCQHLTYAEEGVPEKLFEINMAFYRRLIPYCEEYGIRVAVENMWQHTGMINHSTCSRASEFLRYMDALDDHFVACLDIGHAVLVREDPDRMIRALGGKYLKSLHVHDVDGVVDSHTLPFIGVTDWEAVMKALAEIDYQGEFTYEAGNFLLKTPDPLKQQALNYMGQVGKYLISRFDAYKAEFAAK